ncbi:MAG: hypothetical protein HZA16_03745 [Nitrospirae bacterium]|nr:hypothetical protein [Nitrospirota bacterium]
MTYGDASSEVFWRALKALPDSERKGVVMRMIRDKEFMEVVLHLIIEQCHREPL